MDEIRMRIASNIKKYRKKAGLSVDEVGASLHKSGSTVSAWEVGRGQPDADLTIALCRLLGIGLLDLYGNYQNEDEHEEYLLDIYRNMNANGKIALVASAEGLRKAFPSDSEDTNDEDNDE